ncbi:hypothetical protein ACIG3E_23515 [Streptomyces sp. NPDC053474]|uniref:hypothetical protein n=1 Tax=Streptomyces sp. NPDC053474 TaxID=3365704 RepID=UPI0037CD0A30
MEAHVDGRTAADNGDGQDDQEAVERRRERRKFIVQLLVDWLPVIAAVANHALQRF